MPERLSLAEAEAATRWAEANVPAMEDEIVRAVASQPPPRTFTRRRLIRELGELHPSLRRHWRRAVDGAIASGTLEVFEDPSCRGLKRRIRLGPEALARTGAPTPADRPADSPGRVTRVGPW